MEWKVVNALSRDVERQQINKIFKEIQVEFTKLTQPVVVTPPRLPSTPVRSPVTITLTGDVTGSANGTGQITIQTELADGLTGIDDAPDDGSVYWRGSQQWQEVPLALQFFYGLTGEGLLSINADGTLTPRVVGSDIEDIVVENGDGVNDNPYLYLADVEDVGGGTLQKTEFDSKGRKVGTSEATTDDLPEGTNNLYFTEERVADKLDYLDLKNTLLAGANITLSPDDLSETITITSTGGGGGGGGVETVLPGEGIVVDSSNPEMPIVGLSMASQAAIILATQALQSGDNITELVNDAGYVDEAQAASAAPVQSVNSQIGDVVLTAVDVGAIEEAPIDSYPYVRNSSSWQRLAGPGSPYILLSLPALTDQQGRVLTDQAGNPLVGNVPQIPVAWIPEAQSKVKDIYPLSSLPPVTPYPREIYVKGTSGVTGIIPAYSDGTNWLRFSDNTAVN